MNKATLKCQIFDKKTSLEFKHHQEKTYISEDGMISLEFNKKKDKTGHILYSPTISWVDHQRPSVGFKIETIEIDLKFDYSEGNLKLFQHGYQSWSFSSSYNATDRDVSPLIPFLQFSQENIYTNHTGEPGEFHSEGFTVCYSKQDKSGFFIGVADQGNQNVKFKVNLSPLGSLDQITIIYDIFCSPEFKLNQPIDLVPVKFFTFKDEMPELVIEEYGKELAKKFKIKPYTEEVPTGWCSWYYYYTGISEEIILSNLKEIKNKNLSVAFFQIDDGYQREIGDWTIVNKKFPAGMKFLADEIKKQGFKPGLWLAPFLVRRESEFFKVYPEGVLKDEDGNPVPALWNPLWGMDYTYCLDVTHPRSIEFIEHTFKTLNKDWGYNYLKLDFLYAASLPGVPYNKKLTPHERYRGALELIRKVVGKNTFLLGCGAPLFPSIGIFDGMRIGCDVAPFWYPQTIRNLLRDKNALSTEKALINTLTRSFMHRNFWLNDPDCLIVRKDKNKMTYAQTIMMATIMSLSGGILLVSDNMNTIDPDRISILKKALFLSQKCQATRSYPLGIFNSQFPGGIINENGMIGLWNPEKKESWIEFELPFDVHLEERNIDYWTGDVVYSVDANNAERKLKIMLKPFQTVVLGVKL